MKKLIFTLLISSCVLIGYSQSKQHELSDSCYLTYKDVLDIKLQILAAQMTCGSYRILDMGCIDYPVLISFKNKNQIIFIITSNVDQKLSKEIQENIMVEGFKFVKTGISELIRIEFKGLNLDLNKNIIGYWYLKDSLVPQANWENGKFIWSSDR